jgi:hypothetical protein
VKNRDTHKPVLLFKLQVLNSPPPRPTIQSPQEINSLVQSHALGRVAHSAKSLITLYNGSDVYSAKMRALVWEIESRLSIADVVPSAIHPSLASPLCSSGFIAPGVVYGDLTTLEHAVRLISHPAAWTATFPQELSIQQQQAANLKKSLWDSVASSTSVTMLPTLILSLSRLIPVESRLAYVTLRHSAYSAPGVDSFADMISQIISQMMTYELDPTQITRVAKSLRHISASTLEPFSLYILRCCRKGEERPIRQRSALRAELSHSLRIFFEMHGDDVLYSSSLWASWLLEKEESFLASFYVKYLYDGFQ